MLRNSIGCSTCREWDSEIGLYHYRARAYDPKLGRFLQPDPIGYWGGKNLYAYVYNNPFRYTDPFGFAGDDDSGNESALQKLVKMSRYGNWGGAGYSGANQNPPAAPVDQMDSLFKDHDEGYDRNEHEKADRKLKEALKKLPKDPAKWVPPAKDIERAKQYRNWAEWFAEKQAAQWDKKKESNNCKR